MKRPFAAAAVPAALPGRVLRGIIATALFGMALCAPAVSAARTVTVTLVHQLSFLEGYEVKNLVLDQFGNLYGSAEAGGEPPVIDDHVFQFFGSGTIFQINPSGQCTVVYNFNNALGQVPLTGHAMLYAYPGPLAAGGNGLIYAAVGNSNTSLNTLINSQPTSPISPAPPTIPLLGNLGQSYGAIVAFSPVLPQLLLPVYYFSNPDETPLGPLLRGSDGNLYGDSVSTVFQINAQGQKTTLHAFSGGTDGSLPTTLMQAASGVLYGSAYGGPAPTIFSLTTGGRLTTLHTGAYISAAMVQGRDGNIYGTVANGDGSSYGYVFRITPAGAFSVVHSFAYSDGAYPYSLILGHDGNLYGVTTLGGPGSSPSGPNTGYGTLFQIASNGAFSTVASLGATADFLTLMVQAPDGSFYGTTGFADFGPGSSLTQSIVRVTLH
jgi:uncharacterized repeat protein (TIGR03803 family)